MKFLIVIIVANLSYGSISIASNYYRMGSEVNGDGAKVLLKSTVNIKNSMSNPESSLNLMPPGFEHLDIEAIEKSLPSAAKTSSL